MVVCEHWPRDSFILEYLIWYFDLMLLTKDAQSVWSNVLNT